MYNINFDMGSISSNQLNEVYNNITDITETVNLDNIYSNQYIGSLLNLASTLYFSQLDLNNHMLAEINDIYNYHKISVCISAFELEITTKSTLGLENTKLSDNGCFVMDVIGQSYNTASLSGDSDELKQFKISLGIISSALEDTFGGKLLAYKACQQVKY